MPNKPKILDNRNYIPAAPQLGVVGATPMDRALGRFVSVRVADRPDNQAQRDLIGDSFMMMFTRDPKVKPEDQVPPERMLNRSLMEWIKDNPEFNKGRWTSVANLPAALASAGMLYEHLMSDESVKKALAQQKAAEQAAQKAQQEWREMAQELQKGNTGQAEFHKEQAQQWDEQAKAKAMAAIKGMDRLKQDPVGKGMMGNALKNATQAGEEMSSMMRGWGIEPGGLAPVDAQQVLSLLNQNKDQLKKIVDLFGRLKQQALKTIDKTRNSYTGPVSDPAITRDLLHIFPSERFYLSNQAPPLLHTMKVLQYVDNGLLGWKPKAESKKRGAFQAMIDGSGSMQGAPEQVAKAIALAVASALHDDKVERRYYQLATFGSRGDPIFTVESTNSWKEHIEWSMAMQGGGTDFDIALYHAMNNMRKAKKMGVEGIDLLFVTDGGAWISRELYNDWQAFQKETGCRMIYIDISGQVNQQLEKMTDSYVRVTPAEFAGKANELVVSITEQIVKDR